MGKGLICILYRVVELAVFGIVLVVVHVDVMSCELMKKGPRSSARKDLLGRKEFCYIVLILIIIIDYGIAIIIIDYIIGL